METRWRVVVLLLIAHSVSSGQGYRLGRQARFTELESYLKDQSEPFRSTMVRGIPEENLPPLEPYYINSLKFDLDRLGVHLDVSVHNIKISGMSGFTAFDAIATDDHVTAIFKIPNVEVTGSYDLKGSMNWLPSVGISGDGPVFGKVGILTSKVTMTYRRGPDGVTVTDVKTHIDFDDVSLRLENLLEGSFFQSAVASYINSNAESYLIGLKKEPEWLMGKIMGQVYRGVLNDFFANRGHNRNKRQLFQCGNNDVNSLLDNVIESARPFIKSSADPLPLPYIDEATYIIFHDGRVNGLSTLYRSGNSQLRCDDKTLNAEAELSLRKIGAMYHWTATVPVINYKLSGTVNIQIANATADASVSQKKEKGDHPKIEKLDLKIKGVTVNFSGLGSASFMLSKYISIFTNIFKEEIIGFIEAPIKNALQDQLNKISIPF